MLEAGLIGSRFVHIMAVLSLFGAALFPLYTFRGQTLFDADTLLWPKLHLLLFSSAALAVVSGASWFVFTAGAMAGDLSLAADPEILRALLQATDFGPLWLARIAMLILIVVLLIARSKQQPGWFFCALAALLLASLAGTGHARTTQGWTGEFHIVSDVVHLLAAGMWLGGLWPLGVVIAASRKGAEDTGALADILRSFSGVGTIAVAILVASGLINSWFLVGSPSALIASLYGRVLCAKVALFLVMAMLAAANRFWLTPKLNAFPTATEWVGRLRYHVLGEQALGLSVVGLVAILGTLEPAISSLG